MNRVIHQYIDAYRSFYFTAASVNPVSFGAMTVTLSRRVYQQCSYTTIHDVVTCHMHESMHVLQHVPGSPQKMKSSLLLLQHVRGPTECLDIPRSGVMEITDCMFYMADQW